LQNQKLLKYSPSDNFSPELEREIDDMIAKAAYNESQKTFQQMSQKESLTLAKDMIELQSKEFSSKSHLPR
jgi:ribonucleotide reductase beta subunit family protein with ferritin-like domain